MVKAIKKELPLVNNVFGGHHVKAIPEEIENESAIDYLVWGPVYGSIDKIHKVLGYVPKIDIWDGLEKTAEWYEGQ